MDLRTNWAFFDRFCISFEDFDNWKWLFSRMTLNELVHQSQAPNETFLWFWQNLFSPTKKILVRFQGQFVVNVQHGSDRRRKGKRNLLDVLKFKKVSEWMLQYKKMFIKQTYFCCIVISLVSGREITELPKLFMITCIKISKNLYVWLHFLSFSIIVLYNS